MNEVFAFLFLVVLPICYIGGPNGGREMIAVTLSTLYWITHLWTQNSISSMPLMVLLFAGWLIVSLSWSKSREGMWGTLMLLSCLTAFYVCQRINPALVLLLCFLPAPAIAVGMFYEKWCNRKTEHDRRQRPGGIFGNANHVGIYLATTVFIGIWLCANMGILFLLPVILVAVAAYWSTCNNAQIALIGGTLFYLIMSGLWWWVGLISLMTISTIYFRLDCKSKLDLRFTLFKKGWDLIKERPITGWGINSFRREQSFRLPAFKSHRVHNDYIEFCQELGIIGLILFLGIFYSISWSGSPLLSAQMVVVLLTCLWFFTFREIHTALPTWGLLAVLIPHSGTVYSISYPVITFITVALLAIYYEQAWKRIYALWLFIKATKESNLEKRCDLVMKGVSLDPNSQFTSLAAYYVSLNKKVHISWDLMMQIVYNYDGNLILSSVYDQASRASMMLGAVAISDIFNKMSLQLDPTWQPSIEFEQKINDIKGKFKGGHNV